MRCVAEVIGRFDQEGDADSLLYTPAGAGYRHRHTRVYTFEYEGDAAAVEQFIQNVLVDANTQDLHLQEELAISGAAFALDYAMRPGALDLEKETIVDYFTGLAEPGFDLTSLTITQRIYIFGEGAKPEPFVRDIVNTAIHTWNVHNS